MKSSGGAASGGGFRARAHWLTPELIVYPGARGPARLRVAANGETAGEGRWIPLAEVPGGLPEDLRAKWPHLATGTAFAVPAGAVEEVPDLLRGQVVVEGAVAEPGESSEAVDDLTGIQLAGVLDALFRWDGALGVEVVSSGPPESQGVWLRLWAPTARRVAVGTFDGPRGAAGAAVELDFDAGSGVWSRRLPLSWLGRYYLYEVEVFVPATGRVEKNWVTDPWSIALSRNSRRSQLLDLADPAWQPAGWSELARRRPPAIEDRVLYELHLRDFSAEDEAVPPGRRGTYGAFGVEKAPGVAHLRALAGAGLTHVQLLPIADFATVDEDRRRWRSPEPLDDWPPDGPDAQAAVTAVAEEDGYNWGYDPWHFMVPEGSYAVRPDGASRILEARTMVRDLARLGLGVVMDVVFNHTYAAGQDRRSVLDRVVPGYYHRRDPEGRIATSSCCPNTASEHRMMERLMVDSVLHWARHYRVEGFRFDLMGHHLVRNLAAVREALDGLRPETDGVDGRRIQLLGEGWSFAEMAGNGRGRNASQHNLHGRGIGTFNDRLRDAARGGGPFDGERRQGFLSGLYHLPSGEDEGEARERLLEASDVVRLSLAGNLAAFEWTDRHGRRARGGDGGLGYAAAPRESINYLEAHDNETFFDALAMKLPPATAMAERARRQWLALDLLLLAQGVPLLHAGLELLRSKSGDRNSYDSGDWFNALDFTGLRHRWGVGLPPAGENRQRWELLRPLLADPGLRPSSSEIAGCIRHCREMLQIRRSSPLWRLRTADEVRSHLRFHNVGPAQVPGLIVWSLHDEEGRVDSRHRRLVAILNATPEAWEGDSLSLRGAALELHRVQRSSPDEVLRRVSWKPDSGRFRVPALTTVVFTERR
ncbi:MAG: pullulanase-type alpha-1,6-glucosidase [Acidobacteriota bacterium]